MYLILHTLKTSILQVEEVFFVTFDPYRCRSSPGDTHNDLTLTSLLVLVASADPTVRLGVATGATDRGQ